MERWMVFLVVAAVVFVVIAGPAALILPPDVLSTLPATVAAFVVCWPIAYWFTYYRPESAADDSPSQ